MKHRLKLPSENMFVQFSIKGEKCEMGNYYSKEQDLLLISTLQKEKQMTHVGCPTWGGTSDVMLGLVGGFTSLWTDVASERTALTLALITTAGRRQLHSFGLVKWDQTNIYCRKTTIYHSAFAKYCLNKV